MYKFCKTEQSALRQRELEECLLAAMGSQQFEQITVCDLCDQISIPRKSFYRYFSGKTGALQALLDHTLMECDQMADSDDSRKLMQMQSRLEAFFDFWQRRKPLLDALERSALSSLLVERAIFHALTEQTTLTNIEPHTSQKMRTMTITFVVCGIMSMVIGWHRDGYRESVQSMAETACLMLTRPLADLCARQ